MLDFSEPRYSGRSSGREPAKTSARAPASIGSPREVPVPCASMWSMSAGASPDSSSARRITSSWAGPLGADRPWLRPSWLTAVPRSTASTSSPSRSASPSRLRTSMPAPSAQIAPSASSEKERQRPVGDRPRRRLNSTKVCGVTIRVTPPARARSHSPRRSAWAARWVATREDEQAVSTVSAGPCRPSAYARRPEATLSAEPVPT